MSGPISADARGRLRLLRRDLDQNSERVARAVDTLPSAMIQAAARNGIGARKALSRVIDRIPISPVHLTSRIAVWRVFKPSDHLPDEHPSTERRPVVVTEAILLGVPGWQPMERAPFGCAFTHHALARLLDRSAFSADPVQAMCEAHDALLHVDIQNGAKLFELASLTLPAQDGAFLCSSRRLGSDNAPLTVARTWVPGDQLRNSQVAELTAWSRLLETWNTGEPL